MYKHIFNYELKKQAADKTLWIITVILLLFTILSIYNGSEWVKFQSQTLSKIEDGQEDRLQKHKKDIDEYNKVYDFVNVDAPHNASSIGTYTMHYVIKPPHPNAVFAIGQSDLYPYYVRFSAIDCGNMLINEEILNPVNLLIGKLDFSFFIVYLLPLLIIAMTYDLFASERELGTFTLIRIYHPRTFHFLLMKWLFRVIWLHIVLYMGIILGISLFTPFPLYNYDSGTSLVIIISSLYALFWFSLCFAINMLRKNSLVNGIVLTMLWLFVVFLLPTISNTIMEKRHPLPSRNEQIVKRREVKENTDEPKEYNHFLKMHPEYHRFKSDTVGRSIITGWYPAYMISVAIIDSLNEKEDKRFRKALQLQEEGLYEFSLVSPALMTNLAFNQISRNSSKDFNGFTLYSQKEQHLWRSFVYDKILKGEIFKTADLDYQSNLIVYPPQEISIYYLLVNNACRIFLLAVGLLGIGIIIFLKSATDFVDAE